MKEFSDDDRLYLDDLQIGHRFTSGTHVVDVEQIKAFAGQFDSQPFHLDNEAAKDTLPSEQDVNGVLAAVHGIGANDEIEGMLAAQMVATHFAATRALRRLKGSDTVPQQDSNGRLPQLSEASRGVCASFAHK